MATPSRSSDKPTLHDDELDPAKIAAVDAAAQKAGVRFDDLVEAALLAELESGKEEETVEQAKAHLFVRIARITGGTLLVILGLVSSILPVLPGFIFVIIGLGLLAQDVPFAHRLLEKVKHRMPQDENGNIPLKTKVTMVVGAVFFTSASIAFALWRQSGKA